MDLVQRAIQLLAQQQREWPLLRENHAHLSSAPAREVPFDGFKITLQFNPGRITSSSAPVDEESIRARPCFLCADNRPREQRERELPDEFVLICNPFPIFPQHFTIPLKAHEPQRIDNQFEAMLKFSQLFGGRFVVLYNGPKCGASAPDHCHFQMGTFSIMPSDLEFPTLAKRTLVNRTGVRVCAIEYYLRRIIAIEGFDLNHVSDQFVHIHRVLQEITGSGSDEPMMNIHAVWLEDAWRVLIFPRGRHRPSIYLARGDAQIMFTPAAVDLGGLCALPRQRDFERITREHLIGAFDEVTLDRERFAQLCQRISDHA